MINSGKSLNRIVYLFITAGVAFLIAFTTIILINNKTFVDKVYYRSSVNNAKGLGAKPSIFFKGIEIGRITDFRLNELTNEIDIDFYVFSQYQNKVVQYAVLSGNQNVFLQNATEFELIMPNASLGYVAQQLQPGAVVPFITSRDAQEYIKRGFVTIPADSIESIITSVNNLLINLQRSDNADAGSLFMILDRVAKMSDHLMGITEQIEQSAIIAETQGLLANTKNVMAGVPETQVRIDDLLTNTNKLVAELESVINRYQDPAEIINQVSNGQVPVILDNVNDSLVVIKGMIDEVHAERMQLMVTINTILKVLNKMDKTLQGVNNNPLLKGGIEETPPPKGIEMND